MQMLLLPIYKKDYSGKNLTEVANFFTKRVLSSFITMVKAYNNWIQAGEREGLRADTFSGQKRIHSFIKRFRATLFNISQDLKVKKSNDWLLNWGNTPCEF